MKLKTGCEKMSRKAQQCIAAFVITLIVLGTLFAFALVDLSIDRYTPIQSGPMLRLESINSDGFTLWLMGKEYAVHSGNFDRTRDILWQYRGLLIPRSVEITGMLTTKGYAAAKSYLESPHPQEDLW